MLQNGQEKSVGDVLEYQTLAVAITDIRTKVEYDSNGTPYSGSVIQSNLPDSKQKSMYPEYYRNNCPNPGDLNAGGKHEFSPFPHPVSQQSQLWQVAQTNPNIVVLPATHYLPQHDLKVANHLCWSILVMFFCCWPLGLVAISKSGKARLLAEQGNHGEATEKANSAKSYIVAAFIIGVIFYCVTGAILFYSFYKIQ